jgi:hypothetical protein
VRLDVIFQNDPALVIAEEHTESHSHVSFKAQVGLLLNNLSRPRLASAEFVRDALAQARRIFRMLISWPID